MRPSFVVLLLAAACGSPAKAPAPVVGSAPADPTAAVPPSAPGAPPVALAIVFNGQEIWVGNEDTEEADSPSRYTGALKGIAHALDAADFAHVVPGGSVAEVIAYSDKTAVRVPWMPAAQLTGAAVGVEKDYHNVIGTELMAGLDLAVAELAKSPAARKAIIVIGDGNDTNPDAAKPQLVKLKADLAASHIAVSAIVWKGQLSDAETTIITALTTPAVVGSADNIAPAFAKALHDCCNK